jgi:DNA-binding LacI/PurR family transcriptional regulator
VEKKASILDVAKRAGVGKSTVSRALTGGLGVDSETLRKVLDAARELRYRPNTSARDLRSSGNGRIGILVPAAFVNGFMYQLNGQKIGGAVAAAGVLGYDVQMFIYNTEDLENLDRIIMEKGVAGVLLLDFVSDNLLGCLEEYRIPFVQVNWYVNGFRTPQLYAKTDIAEAMRLGFDCLVERGYRRIGCQHMEEISLCDTTCSDAFRTSAARHGLEKDCLQIVTQDEDEAIAFLEKHAFDAFLSFNYKVSMRILEHCRKRSIRIPEDLAVLSYEHFEYFDYLHPRLSGLRQMGEEIGHAAVEMLDARIRRQPVESRLISPTLILRDSC